MGASVFEVAPGITAIDTFFGGHEGGTAAYLVEAYEPTIVDTGPTTSADRVIAGLAECGIAAGDLAHIVVTHIHLDHAGGVGRLAARFPKATVWAHERGAPHLADPTRLIASATRVYGERRMAYLFGPIEPVPPDRLRPLTGGQRLSIGKRALEVVHTPGHAPHHVALVDTDTGAVFTGDALGVYIRDLRVLRPATPPPDFDVELAVASVERIRERACSVLLFAHFGPTDEIDRVCDLAERRIREWAGVVRLVLDASGDLGEAAELDEVAGALAREAAGPFETAIRTAADGDRIETLSGIRMNASGLIRYWRKRTARPDAPVTGTIPHQDS
jgi:glyoxylase-like metal-dependent hydrolase (beta-lactamase superfamily II)